MRTSASIQVRRRLRSDVRRRKSAATPAAPVAASYDVLMRGDSAARVTQLASLQRLIGNAEVARLLQHLGPPGCAVHGPRPGTAVGYGGMSGLHGRTESTPDGGKRALKDLKVTPASGCTCPEGQKCLNGTATAQITYKTKVTIKMPPMPGGLNACKQGRVRAFFANELGPHEEEHKRRFKTYEGIVKRQIQARGCGLTEVKNDLDSQAHVIQDEEHDKRDRAAREKSDAIDPFFRVVDFEGC